MTDFTEDPLDALAESFLVRFRRGERPPLDEYTIQHPQLADRINELFPALVELEELGSILGPAHSAGRQAILKKLGDYRVIREIGRGGMGVVYEAIQEALNRHVALKVLSSGPHTPESLLERFRREARLAAKLHHGNIVPVFGVGSDGGVLYYAMQFIDGQGLDVVLREVKRQRIVSTVVAANDPTNDNTNNSEVSTSIARLGRTDYYRNVARIGAEAAEALAHAHDNGVLHRDIKPSNLMLDTKGHLWITDFGLAKADDVDDLTQPGDFLGTLRYMAPERFGGQSDARSDVYSLGATLFELVAFEPAFPGQDRAILTQAITQGSHPPLRAFDRAVPRDLETIINTAMTSDVDRRYSSADALASDLRHFCDGEPIRARQPNVIERVSKWARRNPAWATLIVVSFIALASLAVVVSAYNVRLQSTLADVNINLNEANKQNKRANNNLDSLRQAVDQFSDLILKEPRLQAVDLSATQEKLLASAISFHEKIGEQTGDDIEIMAARGKAYGQLGTIHYKLSRYEEARANRERSIQIFEQLVDRDPNNVDYYWELSGSLQNYSNAVNQLGRYDEAASYRKRAQDVARRGLLINPRYESLRLFLGVQLIADVSEQLRIGKGAIDESIVIEAKDLLENIAADHPDIPQAKANLIKVYRQLARVAERNREPDRSETVYRQAIDLARSLVARFPDYVDGHEALAQTCDSFAEFLRLNRQGPETMIIAKEAAQKWDNLIQLFPSRPSYVINAADSFTRVGQINLRDNELESALHWLNRSVELIQKNKLDQAPAGPTRGIVWRTYRDRGLTLKGLERYREAIPNLEIAANIANLYSNRRFAQWERCRCFLALDDRVEAERLCRQMIRESATHLKREPHNVEYQRVMALFMIQMGDLLIRSYRPDEGVLYIAGALAIRERIARDLPDEDQRQLIHFYSSTAIIFSDAKWDAQALSWFAKAFEQLERFATATNDESFIRSQKILLLINRAPVYDRLNRSEEAAADRRALQAIQTNSPP